MILGIGTNYDADANIPRSDPSTYTSQRRAPSSKGNNTVYARGDHNTATSLGRNEDIRSIHGDAHRRRSRSPTRTAGGSGSRSIYSGTSRRRSRSPLRTSSTNHNEYGPSSITDESDRGSRSRSLPPYKSNGRTYMQAGSTSGARDLGGHDSLNYDDSRSPDTPLTRSSTAGSVSNYSSTYPSRSAGINVRRPTKYGDDDYTDCRSSARGSRGTYVTMLQSSPFDNHQFAKSEYKPGVIILAPLHEEDFNRTPRHSYQESVSSYRSGTKSHISHTDFGTVYSEMRFHIVVETHASRYEAIPLYTHKGNGLLHKDNRGEYASIVDHRYPKMSEREAPHTLVTGELQRQVDAFRPKSVAHLVHPVSRPYNLHVRYIGRICDSDIPLLVKLFRNRHAL